MLVHITVNKELRHDPEAMSRLMDLIVETAGMQDVNTDRFHRFAVLSGDVDPDRIAETASCIVVLDRDQAATGLKPAANQRLRIDGLDRIDINDPDGDTFPTKPVICGKRLEDRHTGGHDGGYVVGRFPEHM